VNTSQTTTSSTYTNLTTAGPDVPVTVPASGNVLVTLTAYLKTNSSGATDAAFMGVSTNGACPGVATGGNLVASDTKALAREHGSSSDTGAVQASATYLLTGISAGSHTFRACYRASAGTATFANRNLIVMPLP
jgi:hypothetical protein